MKQRLCLKEILVSKTALATSMGISVVSSTVLVALYMYYWYPFGLKRPSDNDFLVSSHHREVSTR